MKHIIAEGNPIDGLTFYGPFEHCEQAADWAEKNDLDVWWTPVIEDPNEPTTARPNPVKAETSTSEEESEAQNWLGISYNQFKKLVGEREDAIVELNTEVERNQRLQDDLKTMTEDRDAFQRMYNEKEEERQSWEAEAQAQRRLKEQAEGERRNLQGVIEGLRQDFEEAGRSKDRLQQAANNAIGERDDWKRRTSEAERRLEGTIVELNRAQDRAKALGAIIERASRTLQDQ